MMRRVIVLLLICLLLPGMVLAQNGELQFELNRETFLSIDDLGFRLYYPVDWTFDNTNGVTLVENPKDVVPLADNDDSTQPTGLAIRVLGFAAESIEGYEDLTLSDAVDQIVQSIGVEETERVEVPVMTRRSISVFGTAPDGRAGVLTIWKQPDYLVVTAFTGPDMETIINLAYSWGVIIGSIEPIGALELGEETLDLPDAGLSMGYPEGWIPNPENPSALFELESDFDADLPEGYVVGAITRPLGTDTTTIDDVIEENQGLLNFQEPVERSEFVLLGEPAITLRGQSDDGSGLWGLATVFIRNDQAVILLAIAPSEQALDEFMPTWLTILKSVSELEA